jgi:serine/threonine protein kinase/Tol biopolymer transport system component
MNAERYKKIDDLFEAALDLDPLQRSAFLKQACGSDADLRHEVESLLASYHEAGDFIQTPALEAAAQTLAQQHPDSFIGHSIKQYKILSLLGSGGMGEVYVAQDSLLGRKVALKILPLQFTRDPDRVARFQRESRAASSLNHPNIVTIHEIGHDQSTHFIVTELIEGDTLRKKISHGKLPLKEAVEITLQVASALEAAHLAGIIHRDIKPENIMIRRDGYVKVLDFGLAKLTEKHKSDPDLGTDPQFLSTETGLVMGTLSYMSPEQASAREVDQRTDIFSLGVVFYEMVTGKNPFKREHLAATLNAILDEQPEPLTSSRPSVAFDLERVVARMLDKEKEYRYQTAADLRASLKRMQRGIDSGITASASKLSTYQVSPVTKIINPWWRIAAIGFAIVALFSIAAWLFLPRTKGSMPATDWQSARITKVTDQAGYEYFPSLSPDGKSVIYASDVRGNFDIYLQRIGTKKTINLTEDSRDNDTEPTYSPDGTRIAFRSERDGGGIFVMSETGESVRQLTSFGYNPCWSPDGKEIACAEDDVILGNSRIKVPSRLWVISAATGATRLISEGDAVLPSWSPNGKRILYLGRSIGTMRPDGSDSKTIRLSNFAYTGTWSRDGRYIYIITSRIGIPSLWRLAIDETSGETSGEPELIPTPFSYIYNLSFSQDGKRLVYAQDTSRQNIYRLAFDPTAGHITGQPQPVIQSTSSTYMPTISPNGELLAFVKRSKLLILKPNNPIPNQLVEGNSYDIYPRWSSDGKRLAFQSNLSGAPDQIHIMNADGSGVQKVTNSSKAGAVYPIWSPDGTRLAYSIFSGKTYIMDLRKPFDQQTPEETPNFPNSEAYFIAWDWSPDGQYLVGNRGENGADSKGIYTYSLAAKTYEEISDMKYSDLISRPLWLKDSRHILFSTREKILLADAQTKKIQEIFSTGLTPIQVYSLTQDNRFIYASITTPESDIWMISLESN